MSLFVHLHVHSEKSIFDGIMNVKQIIYKTMFQKMNAVAITDHHHIMSWLELEESATKENIKPIFGIELNVDKYHMTALAMNEEGVHNLIQLNNIGHRKNRICVTEKDIFRYKNGIFFLTGCSKGKLFQTYYKKGKVETERLLETYQSLFGNQFAIELTTPRICQEFRTVLKKFESRNTMIIPTNDCHYLESSDNKIYMQNIWLRTLGKSSSESHHRHFKSENEIRLEYQNEQWIQNTQTIMNLCNAQVKEVMKNKNENKNFQIPICHIERFDDIESLKRVLFVNGHYQQAEKVGNDMKKKDLTLEDVMRNEEIATDVLFAFGLRGKIKKIQPHPHKKIHIDIDRVPILKDRRTNRIFSQWTESDAESLQYVIQN